MHIPPGQAGWDLVETLTVKRSIPQIFYHFGSKEFKKSLNNVGELMKSVNEMFIGLGLAVFFSLVAMSAYGDTVINYDDGSTYTLKNNEVIYVAPTKHYTIQTYIQGDIFFRQQAYF